MLSTKIQFNEFAKQYCGTDNREEQIQILKDSLISCETNDEITETELLELFDSEVEYQASLEEYHGYLDIRINEIWECMSINVLNF